MPSGHIVPLRPDVPLHHLTDLHAAYVDRMLLRRDAHESGRRLGPSTGLPTLDKFFDGFLAPGVYVIHGAPGAGKTAFTTQVAVDCGFPSLVVSCEMRPLEMLRRFVAATTRTPKRSLLTGINPPDIERGYLDAALRAAPDMHIADATPGQSIATVRWVMGTIPFVQGHAEHALVVVDSLHAWAASVWPDAREIDALPMAMASLHEIAVHRQVPVVVTAERSKGAMRTGGIAAAAGSRAIEFKCDAMIELDVEFDGVTRQPKRTRLGEIVVTARLAKNRFGPAGMSLPLAFHGDHMRFTEPTWLDLRAKGSPW